MKRWLGALLASAFACEALAADLTFWSWRQEDKAAYAELIAAFHEQHPDINITFEAFEAKNYQTILSTALAAGEGPDIAHVRAYGNLEAIAKPGYLEPLDVPELANVAESARAAESLREDGQVYAMPFASQTVMIYYNTSLFDEHGLQAPETWADFIEVSQALKDKGVIPLANGTADAWQNEVMVGALVPSFYTSAFETDLVEGKATFEDERFVNALEKLNEVTPFLPDGYQAIDYATAQQLFMTGRAAMFAGGSWEIANFRNQAPNLAFDIMPSPAPEAGAPRYVSIFYDGGYAVNTASENKDAAMAFISYTGTTAFADKLVELLGNISPVEGVTISDPMISKVVEMNQTAASYLMLVHFRYEEPSGSVLLQTGVQKMLAGEATPAEVAAEVTKGIAAYHEPFQQ